VNRFFSNFVPVHFETSKEIDVGVVTMKAALSPAPSGRSSPQRPRREDRTTCFTTESQRTQRKTVYSVDVPSTKETPFE
jgi:hypothetical protein